MIIKSYCSRITRIFLSLNGHVNHRAKNVYSRLFLSLIILNLSLERDMRRAMCSLAHAIQQSYKHTHTYTHFRTIRREILHYRSVSHSFCFLILSVPNILILSVRHSLFKHHSLNKHTICARYKTL